MKTLRLMKRAAAPLLAAVLVLGASVSISSSYFTTYVTAKGNYLLELHDVQIIPHERVEANVKNITVENTGEIECYVRVQVIAPKEVPVNYAGEGWLDGGDGRWYYTNILQPGEVSGVLAATISLPVNSADRPVEEGTVVNVEVLTQGAKVLYDEAGNAKPNGPNYEGWELTAKEG